MKKILKFLLMLFLCGMFLGCCIGATAGASDSTTVTYTK